MVDEISELHRLPYNIDQQDLAYESKARRCYMHWLKDVPCYHGKYPAYPADANLFLYGAENLGRLLDDERSRREYEATLINWAVEDGANFQTSPPLLGFADDNYRTGVQSFIFSFVSPDIAQAYGLTTTEIHEYGHHLNLSHPFDGFDYESERDFGWEGRLLLHRGRQREQLDHELHGPQLGLLPVRQGQHRPLPGRGLHKQRQRPGEEDPERPQRG